MNRTEAIKLLNTLDRTQVDNARSSLSQPGWTIGDEVDCAITAFNMDYEEDEELWPAHRYAIDCVIANIAIDHNKLHRILFSGEQYDSV